MDLDTPVGNRPDPRARGAWVWALFWGLLVALLAPVLLLAGFWHVLGWYPMERVHPEVLFPISYWLPGVLTILLAALVSTGPLVRIYGTRRRAFSRALILWALLLSGPGTLLYVWYGRTREQAGVGSCECNLKSLGLALAMYSTDNGGHYPPPLNWRDRLLPYTKSTMIQHCPRDYRDWPQELPSYVYIQPAPTDPPDTTVMLRCVHHRGVILNAYVDARVKAVPEDKALQALRQRPQGPPSGTEANVPDE